MFQKYGSLEWVPIKFDENTREMERVAIGSKNNTE